MHPDLSIWHHKSEDRATGKSAREAVDGCGRISLPPAVHPGKGRSRWHLSKALVT
jgi:hypothetical protein